MLLRWHRRADTQQFGWLKQLKEDKTLVVHAAAQAQKAADFILGNSPESVPDKIIPKTTPAEKPVEVMA